ncbi:IclR family transcriptional regulator [Nocardioides yefusunii]|uniref:IclR family transcriptional regulator n=1 Tax=Nocardioides yefusunii TaxID=2500546 RepID=A0ABW1QV17_9ACTN|nr:IclR family transcriptional regulator [Nocardioides yefusunii]
MTSVTPDGSAKRPSVTSRALSLLGAFSEARRTLTLTEMCEITELPMPTALRLARELVEWGALARTPSGSYVIGRRLWDIGLLAPVQRNLVDVASPYLHDVFSATGATTQLAVRDGVRTLYLERLRGSASVPVVSTIGSRLPLHATGVGKVLLAYAPADVREEVMRTLSRITPYTVATPAALSRQLAKVREEGVATTDEEMTLGACSMAVPVWRGDEVVAALGVVVPSPGRDRVRLVAGLKVASRGISRALR